MEMNLSTSQKPLEISIRFTLLWIYLIVASSFLLTFAADNDSDHNEANPRGILDGKNTSTKLQARVSLESKSFDPDEIRRPQSLVFPLRDDDQRDNNWPATSIPETSASRDIASKTDHNTTIGAKVRSQKSSRRLSNLWSMFLPGTSSDTDYEDQGDSANLENADETSSNDRVPVAIGSSPLSSVTVKDPASSTELPRDLNNRTIDSDAKRNENIRRFPSRETNASSTVSPSSSQNGGSNDRTNGTSDDKEPVQLITGALSQDVSFLQGNNANELTISNMTNSFRMNNNRSSGATVGNSTQIPKENEERADNKESNENFERWLNRIKFQQPLETRLNNTPVAAAQMDSWTTDRPDASWRSGISDLRQRVREHQSTWQQGSTKQLSGIERDEKQSSARDEKQFSVKGGSHPKRAAHLGFSKDIRWATAGVQKQHPFQERLRQENAQLIHGIKMHSPMAQASTISVSNSNYTANPAAGGTQLSNTSLSFGSHYIPQLYPSMSSNNNENNLHTETSVSVDQNRASTNGGENRAELEQGQPIHQGNHKSRNETGQPSNVAQIEQSVFQSQDEILRQVTSAINFEQQQLQQQQQKRSKNNETTTTTSSTNAEQGEELSPDGNQGSLSSARQQQLFKIGSNLNEIINPPNSNAQSHMRATKDGPSTKPSDSVDDGQRSQQTNSSEEVDKSFDLLADKVRSIASLQQLRPESLEIGSSSNDSSPMVPTWLRQTTNAGYLQQLDQLLKSQNISLNNTSPQGNNGGSRGGNLNQLDQIRELISRHEKTKNELKNSQESMMEMMKQMMQLKSSPSGSKPSGDQRPEKGLAQKSGEQQQTVTHPAGTPAGATNLGWSPSGVPKVSPRRPQSPNLEHQQLPNTMRSPANLIKNKPFRQPGNHEQRPAIGQNHHNLMIEQQFVDEQQAALAKQPDFAGVHLSGDGQQMLGLPIALLNNDNLPANNGQEYELSPGQIEEAARIVADQLSNSGQLGDLKQRPQDNNAAHQIGAPDQSSNEISRPLSPASRLKLESQTVSPAGLGVPQEERRANEIDSRGPNRHQPRDSVVFKPSLPANNRPQAPPQQQIPRPAAGGNVYMQAPNSNLVQAPMIAQYHQQQQQIERFSPQQYITTSTLVTQSGGPPMKMREISVARPFGFRTNHAISYQPPAAVSTVLSRLKSSTSQSRPLMAPHQHEMEPIVYGQTLTHRPSLQSPPIRPGGLFGGRGPIAPIRAKLAQVVMPHQHHHIHQNPFYPYHHQQTPYSPATFGRFAQPRQPMAAYPTHNALGQTLPIQPSYQLSRAPYRTYSLSPHPPLRRDSQQQQHHQHVGRAVDVEHLVDAMPETDPRQIEPSDERLALAAVHQFKTPEGCVVLEQQQQHEHDEEEV